VKYSILKESEFVIRKISEFVKESEFVNPKKKNVIGIIRICEILNA